MRAAHAGIQIPTFAQLDADHVFFGNGQFLHITAALPAFNAFGSDFFGIDVGRFHIRISHTAFNAVNGRQKRFERIVRPAAGFPAFDGIGRRRGFFFFL